MPGMNMNFKCPCGFNAKNVTVGATQEEYCLVVLCLECHRLFSLWRKGNNSTVPICKSCGKPLMSITAPGAWSPSALQAKFPDSEPWLIDEGSSCEDELIEDEIDQFKEIRIMCPRCKKYSVEFKEVAYWD